MIPVGKSSEKHKKKEEKIFESEEKCSYGVRDSNQNAPGECERQRSVLGE